MVKQKEPKNMNLGELIKKLIKAKKRVIQLYQELDSLTIYEKKLTSPYPECVDSMARKNREEYKFYVSMFLGLEKKLNIAEELYLKK